MKKNTILALVVTVLSVGIFSLSSCEKDKGTPPNIAFKTDAGYVSKDTSLATSTAFKFGIKASLAESGDWLKKLNISVSTNGGADSTIQNIDIPTPSQSNYDQDFNYVAGAGNTNQKFTFTVTNRDGISNQVSAKVTYTP